jgi:hypothetical protein
MVSPRRVNEEKQRVKDARMSIEKHGIISSGFAMERRLASLGIQNRHAETLAITAKKEKEKSKAIHGIIN